MTERRKSTKPGRPAGGSIWSGRAWVVLVLIVGGTAMWTYLMTRQLSGPQAPPVHANGLRVSGAGRSDASHVLDPARFANERVRQAYAIAHAIPPTLNQLYCWCHCEETLGMRSLLECYESEHAAGCEICLGEAELAWELTQQGTTDAARIQAAVDAWIGKT